MTTSGANDDLATIKESKIFQELVKTEQDFLTDLKFLQSNQKQILALFPDKPKKGELSKNDLKDAFKLLPELIEAHQGVLISLRTPKTSQWEAGLKQLESSNIKYAILFDKLHGKVPPKIDLKFNELEGAKGLGIGAFLIKPVQRYLKYPLIFREFEGLTKEKKTETSVRSENTHHNEIVRIKESLDKMAKRMNDAKRNNERLDVIDNLINAEMKKGKKTNLQTINDLVNIKGIILTQIEKKETINIDSAISQLKAEKELRIKSLIPGIKKTSTKGKKPKKSKQSDQTQIQLNQTAIEIRNVNDLIATLPGFAQKGFGRDSEKILFENLLHESNKKNYDELIKIWIDRGPEANLRIKDAYFASEDPKKNEVYDKLVQEYAKAAFNEFLKDPNSAKNLDAVVRIFTRSGNIQKNNIIAAIVAEMKLLDIDKVDTRKNFREVANVLIANAKGKKEDSPEKMTQNVFNEIFTKAFNVKRVEPVLPGKQERRQSKIRIGRANTDSTPKKPPRLGGSTR